MGIFDQAKDALGNNPDAVDSGIDKAADVVDDKTGGQYAEQVDQGAETAKDKAGDFLGASDDEGQQEQGQEPQQ